MSRPKLTIRDRLLSKVWVEKKPDGAGCWLWQGYVGPLGYGNLWVEGASVHAHRVSYQEFYGSLPDGCHIHHRCGNKRCVRPDHLEALTVSAHAKETNAFSGHIDKWRDRTHCKNGHEFTEENTKRDAKGYRVCVTCARERTKLCQRKRRAQDKEEVGPGSHDYQRSKTHCPQGHPYSGDNLRINTDGGRRCRECGRIRSREKYHAKHPEAEVAHRARTHCKRGHPYDEQNTRWHQGRRYCRACNNEISLARYHARKSQDRKGEEEENALLGDEKRHPGP